jgi:hypothetical protein
MIFARLRLAARVPRSRAQFGAAFTASHPLASQKLTG